MLINLKRNYFAYLVMIGGVIGFYAAFTLLLNRIEYYKNPNFIPPCSINPWLDCGVVMKSKWATLYGFPNTIIGIATYPLSIFTGLIMILNKDNNKLLMNLCLLLAGLGMITNIVLLYISSYLIASLCPWCILAGIATSNIFFSLLFYNIKNDHLVFGNHEKNKALINGNWDIVPVVVYYFLIFLFVYISFVMRDYSINTTKFFDPIFWLWSKPNM
jgi:uncharacterized membrane protein